MALKVVNIHVPVYAMMSPFNTARFVQWAAIDTLYSNRTQWNVRLINAAGHTLLIPFDSDGFRTMNVFEMEQWTHDDMTCIKVMMEIRKMGID